MESGKERPVCSGVTQKGKPCKKLAVKGHEFCSVHLAQQRSQRKKEKEEAKKAAEEAAKDGPQIDIPEHISCRGICKREDIPSEDALSFTLKGLRTLKGRLQFKTSKAAEIALTIVNGAIKTFKIEPGGYCPDCAKRLRKLFASQVKIKEDIFGPFTGAYKGWKLKQLEDEARLEDQTKEIEQVVADKAKKKEARDRRAAEDLGGFAEAYANPSNDAPPSTDEEDSRQWLEDVANNRLSVDDIEYFNLDKLVKAVGEDRDHLVHSANPHLDPPVVATIRNKKAFTKKGNPTFVMHYCWIKVRGPHGGLVSRVIPLDIQSAEELHEISGGRIGFKSLFEEVQHRLGLLKDKKKGGRQKRAHDDRRDSSHSQNGKGRGQNGHRRDPELDKLGLKCRECSEPAVFNDRLEVDFEEVTREDLEKVSLCEDCGQELAEKRGATDGPGRPGSNIFPLGKTVAAIKRQGGLRNNGAQRANSGDDPDLKKLGLKCRECDESAVFNDRLEGNFEEVTREDLEKVSLCEKCGGALAEKRGADGPGRPGSDIFPLGKTVAAIKRQGGLSEEEDTSSDGGTASCPKVKAHQPSTSKKSGAVVTNLGDKLRANGIGG